MSSDNEENNDLEYGIDDGFGQAFALDDSDQNELEIEKNIEKNEYNDESYNIPSYERNVKKAHEKEEENDDKDQCPLDDLMNLIEQEDETDEKDKEPVACDMPNTPVAKSSITITKIDKKSTASGKKSSTDKSDSSTKNKNDNATSDSISLKIKSSDPSVFTESFTGVRLIKSPFGSETELNMRLKCDYGKYFKLIDLHRYETELKEKDSTYQWFSIFLLNSKTESKTSANGNKYVVWRLTDVNHLDKEANISLFIFGSAYKTYWKASPFQVFALVKPEFFKSNKNGVDSKNNGYSNSNNYSFNSPSTSLGKKPVLSTNWNKFAGKNLSSNLQINLTMCIKADYQLVDLGFARDITACQSMKQSDEASVADGPKRCRNLVNLQQAPYCIYHCKQMDKSGGGKFSNSKYGNSGGKYSMDRPSSVTSRFGSSGLFPSTPTDVQFMPSNMTLAAHSFKKQMEDRENRQKAAKNMKAEILLSLNSSIKESPVLANVAFKPQKRSDKETMAMLNGQTLTNEEIREIRLAEQATIRHNSNMNTAENKSLSRLFTTKTLINSDKLNLNGVGVIRLNEMKRNMSEESCTNDALKQKMLDKKNSSGLSTATSHRDVLKQLKKQSENSLNTSPVKNTLKAKEESLSTSILTNKTVKPKMAISEFLASTLNRIKDDKANSLSSKSTKRKMSDLDDDFELELFDSESGQSVTKKKLFDVNKIN